MTLFGGGKKRPASGAIAARIERLREDRRDAAWLVELLDRVQKLEAEVAQLRRESESTKELTPDESKKR